MKQQDGAGGSPILSTAQSMPGIEASFSNNGAELMHRQKVKIRLEQKLQRVGIAHSGKAFQEFLLVLQQS